jgi:hypothetical protein
MFRKVKVPVRHPAWILLRTSADVSFRFLAWFRTCLHSHVRTVLPHILSSAVKALSRSVMKWTSSSLLIYLSTPASVKTQIAGSQQWFQSQTAYARRCLRIWQQTSESNYSFKSVHACHCTAGSTTRSRNGNVRHVSTNHLYNSTNWIDEPPPMSIG